MGSPTWGRIPVTNGGLLFFVSVPSPLSPLGLLISPSPIQARKAVLILSIKGPKNTSPCRTRHRQVADHQNFPDSLSPSAARSPARSAARAWASSRALNSAPLMQAHGPARSAVRALKNNVWKCFILKFSPSVLQVHYKITLINF